MVLPAIDAVVFDIGGVLIDWQPERVYAELIPDSVERERFFAEVCSREWIAAWDAGRPLEEACRELSQRFPHYEEAIHAWRRQDEMVAEMADTIAIVDELSQRGVRLFLLTNMPVDVFDALVARFAFLRHFRGAVVSGAERVIKPEAAIFNILVERYGLDVARTLFIDDSPANVAAAQALGFRAHRFETAPKLVAELAQLGLVAGTEAAS